MQKNLVGTALCKKQVIRYYLLAELLEGETESYGVSIEYRGEEMPVHAVTCVPKRMEALVELLQRGCVTPVTARDVIEDWILDSSCNF